MGQIKKYMYGNGIETSISRTQLHHLEKIEHGNLLKQECVFDPADGNLFSRKFTNMQTNTPLYEVFNYDIDRLKTVTQINPVTLQNVQQNNINYSFIGNINHKDDAGDYVYGTPTKPYTLTALNNATNNLSLNTLSFNYTDFKMVEQIAEATTGKVMNFTYGNNNQRIKVDYLLNSQNQYTRYYACPERPVSSVAEASRRAENYDKQISTTETKQWNYIYIPSGLSAVYYVNNGNGQLLYTLTDHLGSPILLSNTAGQVVEEYSYACPERSRMDAWGRRRDPATWAPLPPTGGTRGYTFNEHLDEFNLINMNARLYDPLVARVLSPDNYVQGVDATQTHNRYSYVHNNSLKFTDPDGSNPIIAAMMIGAFANAVMTGWQGGSSKQMMQSAIIGAASSALGAGISGMGFAGSATAALAASSTFNSFAMNAINGSGDLTTSFGAGSYNWNTGKFRSIFDWGNLSNGEKLGYTFGALANYQDIVAGFNGTNIDVKSRPELAGHSQSEGSYNGENILISVGPDEAVSQKIDGALGWEWEYVKKSLKFDPACGVNNSYIKSSDPAIVSRLNNVNGKILLSMTKRLNSRMNLLNSAPLDYGLLKGCVNYNARALFFAGVPNINALLPVTAPVLLNLELLIRQAGIYANPYLIRY